MSASNSSTTHKPTPVADDTTNTPYNPDKHGTCSSVYEHDKLPMDENLM